MVTKNSFQSTRKLFSSVILFLLIFVTMSFTSLAIAPQDLILQARTNSPIWSQYETYTENESVLYNGQSFKSKNTNIGLENRPDINPAGWENIPVHANANALQILNSDNFTYNGYVGIKGNFNGQETKIFKRNLIALDNYQKQQFEVIIYTGNDNKKYSVYHHSNMTDNRSFVREQGEHLFDVYSKDGFVAYNTSDFSTQILAMPDIYMTTNDYYILPTDGYFIDYDVDYTEVSLEDTPSNWGYSFNQVQLVKGSGLTETNPDMDILHGTANLGQALNPGIDLGDEIIEYQSYTDSLEFRTYVVVQDGFGNYEGDNYYTYVTGSVSQIASISNANIDGTNGAERNWGDFFLDYETIEITYNDGGLVNLTQSIGDSVPDSNYGTNFDTVLDYYNGEVILYMYGNNVDSGPTTITVKAIGYDSSQVTDTFTLTTTSEIIPGDVVGIAPNSSNAKFYYSFDDDDLTGSNPDDLTSNNNDGTTTGATTGSAGIVNQAFSFDGDNDEVDSGIIPNDTDFTYSTWFKTSSTGIYSAIFSSENGATSGFKGIFLNTNQLQLSTSSGSRFSTNIGSVGQYNDGNWHNFVLVKNSNTWTVYVDNIEKYSDTRTVTTATTSLHIGNTDVNDNDFNGLIDESTYFTEALNVSNVAYLYNNGTPTDVQQYPFSSGVSNPPTWNESVGFPTLLNNTYPSVEQINLGYRWSNYDDLYMWFTDPTNASLINMTIGTIYNGTYFNVDFDTISETVNFYTVANYDSVTLNFQACNAQGCNTSTQTTELILSGADIPTFNGASLNVVDLFENESSFYNLDSYFDDYTTTYITYTDPDNVSLINITNGQSSNNSYFEVSLVGADLFTINTYSDYNNTISQNFTVSVCNMFGCVTETDFIKYVINPDPTNPPTQIAGFIDFDVYVNQTYNISLGNYFVNATSYNIYFINPATTTNQSLSLGQTVDAIYFNITYQIGNIIQIYGYSEVSNNPVYVQACNTNGCLNYTSFNFDVIERPVVTEPPNLGETFDLLLGVGDTKVKLFVALIFILLGCYFGYTVTTSGLGVMIGFGFGLLMSFVFGLITLLPIVLIIMFVLALAVIYTVFVKKV